MTYPLGYPLASNTGTQRANAGGTSGDRLPTKDSPSGSRLTAGRLAAINVRLSDRDQRVLELVARFRLASGVQLARLFWPEGTPQTRARLSRHGLARLVSMEVLATLTRRVGGVRAGSSGHVFALGPAGQRLVNTAKRSRSVYTPGERHLAHTLAVTELYVQLTEAQRWGLVQLLAFEPEPICWRSYAWAWGARLTLKPDAALTLAAGAYELAWLIEVDRATESLTTICRKAQRHIHYHRSGAARAAGGLAPRVAWIVPDQARAEAITGALSRLPAHDRLFVVMTAEDAATQLGIGERA